ncbi:hypothetical protein Poli38472_005252 [Pythium oligandrum]|uniref:Homeobox domain-containing protein n=1 Tax=Pythium oligandrum TaxID=41045 RepID=A0A8K1CFP5_PYTOL|nr:hypothetical protein Poli38472_005252 [Pythium oligandrum]|eukprot:TMW62634.1 hypothetical protein Poli38472_005252 [Pythium oligandrum]
MSAMKMEFICEDNSEDAPRQTNANANAKLSALLNRASHGDSDVEMHDATERNGTDEQGAAPPRKKAKTEGEAVNEQAGAHADGDVNGLSDNENSEDEQVEYAPWEEVDLNPAVDLVNKVVRESLEAGKTYNKSITAKTSQLISGCDTVLLELKNLSDAREASRKQSSKQQGPQDGDCTCGVAMSILPLVGKSDSVVGAKQNEGQSKGGKTAQVDEIAEDQTDRVLFKIEASMERLRELAELIQATSMQGEANLVSKVTLADGVIGALNNAIQASAASATAAAIAQERGRTASMNMHGRLYSPLQVKKLQDWYYSYPRPLTDELTLMRTILNYRPFANPFIPGGLTIAHIRDWFKRRRYRERLRYVKLAVEAGRDPVAAEEEIDLRIEQRIEHLRMTVDPNELVKELDKVRAESSLYDSMITSFARPETLDSYVSASHALPSFADHLSAQNGGRVKRQRTQDSDLDDAIVVKIGTPTELIVMQNRIRSLLAMPRSATNTNALQQVIDILRSMEVSKEVRIQTGVVADLKKILKVYKKPTLLRNSTIALLESLGMSRRVIMDDNAHDEEPTMTDELSHPSGELSVKHESTSSSAGVTNLTSPVKISRGKKEKGKIQRPMKFSMKQVMALEAWFQQKYKPTQTEMEEYLDQLNSPPLRDEKQPVDVNMTQLRRWFNKRRCLRRPPFALMTQQDAAKDDIKATDEGKVGLEHDEAGGDEFGAEAHHHESADNTNDDSSDDDVSSDDE